MSSLPLEEAQARLPELIDHLQPSEALVITRNEKPVARLGAESPPRRKSRKAGSAKGILSILQEDDEYLEDFEEYLPGERCLTPTPSSGSSSTTRS